MSSTPQLAPPTQTVTFETQIPQDIYLALRAHGLFREALAEQSQHLLALRFYQDHLLSLGQAARLAGLDRWAFIELLGENQIPVIDYDDEELANEFDTVDQLIVQLKAEPQYRARRLFATIDKLHALEPTLTQTEPHEEIQAHRTEK